MCLECTATQHMLIAVEANTSDEAFKAFGVQERLMPAEWAMRNTSYLNRMSFCIRHVPRPWKSNSTVQRGRRRHVQEASGRWRTRLAGKEKEILSVQKSNSPETSGGFSDFEMSWLDPREIHQTVHCQVCISTPWIWRRLAWLHHARPCSHAVFRFIAWPGPSHCGICICKILQSCILNYDCHCITHLDIATLYRSILIFQPFRFAGGCWHPQRLG